MDEEVDPRHADGRIAALAASQWGVVSRVQLRALGLGRGAIDQRLAAGRLLPLHRGVYAVGHDRLARRGRFVAAVLASGAGAVLSHRSAAAVWGLRPSAGPWIDVTIPTRTGRKAGTGIRLHRAGALTPDEATSRDGIPVTTPARTLLDLAATVQRHELARALNEAERLRIFDLTDTSAVLCRHHTRPGTRNLAGALRQWDPAETLTRSELERRFLELCAEHALPAPRVNTGVLGFEVDFLWEPERVIVEIDGWAYHSTRSDYETDRARDAELAAAGFRVVRFTYRRVFREPAAVARTLRRLLGR
jgi:very-short-patch-repair endonuclease